MEASLYVSKTGLDAQQMRMTVISNNLANVNTIGYKRDRAVFEDLLYQNIRQAGGSTGGDNQSPTGLMIGTGVRIIATEKTHTQGSMIQTKNALDLAIQRLSRRKPDLTALGIIAQIKNDKKMLAI